MSALGYGFKCLVRIRDLQLVDDDCRAIGAYIPRNIWGTFRRRDELNRLLYECANAFATALTHELVKAAREIHCAKCDQDTCSDKD